MANNQINKLLEFANMQMAAEAFLQLSGESSVPTDAAELRRRLELGNTHASTFTPIQARQFTDTYEVLAQYQNDPTKPGGTGFSGTLFKNRATGELTLSFRSTEFIDDAVRDSLATNQLEIKDLGWALGQISEMDKWYQKLRADPNLLSGKNFNVTGYSLGGHLATAFNILRREEATATGIPNPIIATYTFNGAGTGKILSGTLTDLISDFERIRANYTDSTEWKSLSFVDQGLIRAAAQGLVDQINKERARVAGLSGITFALEAKEAPTGNQASVDYQIAALLVGKKTVGAFAVNPLPNSLVPAPVEQRFSNMTEIVGMETAGLATSFVSNSGQHYGVRQEVPIEAQPFFRGAFPPDALLAANLLVNNPDTNNFADTHSIVLVVDSLSLLAVMETMAPNLTLDMGKQIFASMSNTAASELLFTQGTTEGDTLERTLDALRKLILSGDPASTLSDQQIQQALKGGTWASGDLRARFYNNLNDLNVAIDDVVTTSGTFVIDSLVNISAAQLTGLAGSSEAIAYRYALKELNPFAVLGNNIIYAPHNLSGELNLYNAAGGTPAGMTNEYIADRTKFLLQKNQFFTQNSQSLEGVSGEADSWLYRDTTSKLRFDLSGTTAVDPSLIGPAVVTHTMAFGGDSADGLRGGDVSDRLYGGLGADVLSGGAGDDYLEGGAGMDVYNFGAGQGVLGSSPRNDGNDTILDTDGKGALRYTFSDGSNPLSTNLQTTVIAGAAVRPAGGSAWQSIDGKFTYTLGPGALGGNDLQVTFSGGVGGSLTLQNFHDRDFGIRLIDMPVAPATTRTIRGDLSPVDFDPVASGVQFQHDDIGNIVVDGGSPAPDREDFIVDSAGNDFIDTLGGNDKVVALAGGDNRIKLGVGRDSVFAGGGNDYIEGGSNGAGSGDIVDAGAGSDVVFAENDSLDFAFTLNSVLNPDAQSTGLKGDFINAGTGDDVVVGAADDDVIFGGDGMDVLIGGAGNDTISGDGAGIATSFDWTVTRNRVDTAAESEFFNVFSSVNIDSSAQAGAADTIYGGAGVDWIFAGGGDDFVDGGSGDDVILGEGGGDILIGGDGADYIDGDSAQSIADNTAGNDYLDGGAGNDSLSGRAGDDILLGGSGDDTLFGGIGNDLLEGGTGNDILVGGAGKDTYVFSRGDGTELIYDTPTGINNPEASLLVLHNVSASDIKFRQGSLEIDLGQGDEIHFENFDPQDPLSTPVLGAILFDDGTLWSYQDVLDRGFDNDGTEGDDFIVGTAVTDRIDAKGGNDTVLGSAGNDTILGGAGDDMLDGGLGNDTLDGGEGDDTLSGYLGDDVLAGGAGNDSIDGFDGNDTLAGGVGDDTLIGGAGDDVMNGGANDDILIGNEGADTYSFAAGDGHDIIADEARIATNFVDTASIDVVRFDASVLTTAVTLLREANGDLLIDYGAGDEITIQSQFTSDANAIEEIRFADGTVFNKSYLNALPIAPITGTPGNDTLTGTTGNDTLQGGAGADTYLVNIGMGVDTAIDPSPSASEVSTLQLDAGLTLDSLNSERRQNDLFIGLRGTPDGILIQGYFDTGSPAQFWQIKQADGAIMPMADLLSRPDPFADNAALAAMVNYKQGLLSNWAAESIVQRLPDHALVFTARSQTTVETSLSDGTTLTDFLPTNITINILDYGIVNGPGFSGMGTAALQSTVIPEFVTRHSDAAVIQATGVPTSTSSVQDHTVTRGFTPIGGGNNSTIRFATSVSTTNTVVSSGGNHIVPITLDRADGPVDGIFSVTQVTDHRVIEEIDAGNGANAITGGDGSQNHIVLINAGGGDDIVQAGATDFVYGDDGNDTITGGAIAYGGNGDDIITGATDQYGGAGSDYLLGGRFMDGGGGVNFLTGMDGATTFFVNPADSVFFELVQDTGSIGQTSFEDLFYMQSGIADPEQARRFASMWLVTGHTNHELNGVNETFPGQSVSAFDFVFNPVDGFRQIYSSLADLRADLNKFNIAYNANDVHFIAPLPALPPLPKATDYDALAPFFQNGSIAPDTLEFGSGVSLNDVLVRRGESNTLDFSWGDNNTVSVQLATADDPIGTGVEFFKFADGSQYYISTMLQLSTQATAGDDVIVYTDGNDTGSGLDGNDTLIGLGGDDALQGNFGNDTLEGDAGNDLLVGGEGSDTYTFSAGDGQDVIDEQGFIAPNVVDAASVDTVQFDFSVHSSDVTLVHELNGDLLIQYGLSDQITVVSQFTSDANAIEQIRFAFNSEAFDQVYLDALPYTGTAAVDVLVGNGGNNNIFGLDGNDILVGGAGDDSLDAGSNNNLLYGGSGDDYAYEEGQTLFIGGSGDDLLDVYGDGTVAAFNAGDGNDVVYAVGSLTLSLGAGIDPASITLSEVPSISGVGTDLLLNIGPGDSIQLSRAYETDPQAWPTITLQTFGGGSVTTYDFNAVINDFNAASSQDPAYTLTLGNVLSAHILSSGLTDTIGGDIAYQYAVTGNTDSLTVADQQAVLADANFGLTAQATTAFPSVVNGTAGNDVLSGSAGNDLLAGGAGNDILTGGLGSDTYLFNVGGGVDHIVDTAAAGAGNVLQFGAGITPDMLTLSIGSLLININDGLGDAVHLDTFDPADASGTHTLDTIRFADGSTLNYSQLLARGFDLTGTAGDDIITGTSVDDRITGGAGNDTLSGGTGNDRYFFALGSGSDTVIDVDSTPGNFDTIEFGAGIVPTDLLVSRDVDDIVIHNSSSGDQITVKNWFQSAANQIEQVRFANGATLDAAALQSLIPPPANQPPVVASPVADQSATQDQPFGFAIPVGTFADPDAGDVLTESVTLASGAALPSWLTFDPIAGMLTGTPLNADVGNYSIKLTATDTGGMAVSNIFGLTVANVNDAPVTVNEATAAQEDVTLIASGNVLANDSDIDVGTVLNVAAPGTFIGTYGTLVLGATGAYTYTLANASIAVQALAAGQNVADTFELAATDGMVNTAETLTVSIAGTNDAPVTANDAGAVQEDVTLVATGNVLANDSDVDQGTVLNVAVPATFTGTYGTLVLGANGSYNYTLNNNTNAVQSLAAGQSVTDVFGYAASDGLVNTAGSITVSIAGANDSPVANPDSVNILENATTLNLVAGLLANDTDVDEGDARTITAVTTTGTVGIVAFNAGTQTLTYAANGPALDSLAAGVTASDTFTYIVKDSAGASSLSTVTMTITGINDAPTLAHAIANQAAIQGTAFTFLAPDTTFADVDRDDVLTYSATLADGTALPNWLAFDSVGRTFSGTPALTDAGSFNIRLTVTDTGGLTATSLFGVTVSAASFDQYIVGTSRNDVLTGGVGNDTLSGGAGADILAGGAGNDWLDGGTGADKLNGGTGNDTYIVDNAGDIVTENPGEGFDTMMSSVTRTISKNVERLILTGTSSISAMGSASDDVLIGNSSNNTLSGGAGNDLLNGGIGKGADTLNGGGGNDVLEGMDGNDTLSGAEGNNLFSGGAGADTMTGSAGNDCFIGGAGNDMISTGKGADVIVFNRGDGRDTVNAVNGLDNTISFGGGISYADLTFKKTGKDLILNTGNNEGITFKNWYDASSNRSVLNLQVITEAMSDFYAQSVDPLFNHKVDEFDFSALVTAFDRARTANGNLQTWSLMNKLLDAHIASSDTEALGGDIAYRYGLNGSLAGMALTPVQNILASPLFGTQAQALQPLAGLQEGLVKLS